MIVPISLKIGPLVSSCRVFTIDVAAHVNAAITFFISFGTSMFET